MDGRIDVSIYSLICDLPCFMYYNLEPKFTSVNLQIDPDVDVTTRELRRTEENMATVT